MKRKISLPSKSTDRCIRLVISPRVIKEIVRERNMAAKIHDSAKAQKRWRLKEWTNGYASAINYVLQKIKAV